MQSYWVTVSYDAETVLSNCYTVKSREEAVSKMMTYLELEFNLPKNSSVRVNHHY